jgi:four helix bundle protein
VTYSRFEDLPVWQAAMRFALEIFELVRDRTFNGAGDLRDQLQRASLSISLNIAEGFERGTTNELLYFLYVARGSAGEARSGLRFCDQHPPMTHLRTRVRGLIVQGEGSRGNCGAGRTRCRTRTSRDSGT